MRDGKLFPSVGKRPSQVISAFSKHLMLDNNKGRVRHSGMISQAGVATWWACMPIKSKGGLLRFPGSRPDRRRSGSDSDGRGGPAESGRVPAAKKRSELLLQMPGDDTGSRARALRSATARRPAGGVRYEETRFD